MRKQATIAAGALVASALTAATMATTSPASAATRTATAAYTVATIDADGQTLTARWNPCQAAITIAVNVDGAGRTARARRAALADARHAVSDLASATGMPFQVTGTTSFVPTGSDWADTAPAEIVIAWIDNKAGRTSTLLQTTSNGMRVAATGGYSFKRWSYGQSWEGVIGRGFVVVNPTTPQVQPGYGAGITRGNLLLHELGHVVGLQHTASEAELMNPVLLPRDRTGYRSGDLAGLATVGSGAGCVTVPDAAFTDL